MASKGPIGLDMISVSLVMGDRLPGLTPRRATMLAGIGGISLPHCAEIEAGGGGRIATTIVDFAGSGKGTECIGSKHPHHTCRTSGIAEKDQRGSRY